MSYRFFLCALLAVFLHGAGHLLFAHLVGVRFCKIRRSPTGLRLITDGHGFHGYVSEGLVALGGPAVNILSALLCP